MKSRPYRIYKHKGRRTGRYLRREGKRVYIKTQKKMSDKALVNVMIKNTINGHRRVRTVAPIPKSEHKPLAYSQPIASTLKTVPHTPFFSHNDQTKEKKLTDEIDELKKNADKKDREHTEAQNLSVAQVKKAIEEAKNSEFKTKQQERISFFESLKAEGKNQRKIRDHVDKYDKLHKASVETIDRQEKDYTKNMQDKERAHKKDTLERAMESDTKSRQQAKKHDDKVRQIISEQPPPVHKQTHEIATGDDNGAVGEENHNLWNPSILSKGRLQNILRSNNVQFPAHADKDALYNLAMEHRLLDGKSAKDLHREYFEHERIISSPADGSPLPPKNPATPSRQRRDAEEMGAIPFVIPEGDEGDGVGEQKGNGDTYVGEAQIHIGEDGMGTSQIEDFLKGRTHHIIPCIPRDEMDSLLPYVSKNTKEFGFVFNSENHTQGGQHWRACYINTETGDCDFFDSLVSEPDKVFMKGITSIIKKIDPTIYLKFKINRVKIQSNSSANCGQFCCRFLDKMYHGGTFRQATYYDCINGEKDITKYKSKWGLL